jgi:STE24 endopeptidase
MPFLLLICLMTACLPIRWPEPPLGMGIVGSALFTGMTTCALLLIAGAIARRALLQLEREPNRRDSAAHRYSAARSYFFFASLGGFAFCLLGLGWGDTATQLGMIVFRGRWVLAPGGELLILAPFLLVQVGSWCFFFDADRALHQLGADPLRPNRFWTRGGYVLYSFRQQILILMPLFFAIGGQAVSRLFPELNHEPWLVLLLLLGVVFSLLVLLPLALPLFLGLRPLPRGPIRDRLEAHARRLGVRYSRIYLWDTRGAMANAMVLGVIGWLRCIIFTDRLLDDLDDDEVDGVFGHEVGHAYYGHMLYYAFFLLLSATLLGAIAQAGPSSGDEYSSLDLIAPLLSLFCYLFAVFGFVSRRCERQADIFGCRAGSCRNQQCKGHDCTTVLAERGTGLCLTGINNFVKALRRVEDINGMNRPNPAWRGVSLLGKVHWIFRLLTGWLYTWQHSTISKRVAFLERMAVDPTVEQHFQSRIWVLKWLIAIGLLACLIGLGAWQGWDKLLPTL